MKKNLTDFLIPIYGPIDAFYKADEESLEDLNLELHGKISHYEYRKREIINTAYVFVCGAVSTLELNWILDKISKL